MTIQTHDEPRARFDFIQHRLEVDAPAHVRRHAQLDDATWPEAEPELGGAVTPHVGHHFHSVTRAPGRGEEAEAYSCARDWRSGSGMKPFRCA